jgi:predicted dehydrogenase
MNRTLRVAVIGVGFGQQVHVPAFRADSRCRVTMLCASSEAKAADVAHRLNVPHASGDWRSVVASAEIDLVSIAVPPRLQPAIAIEALDQGKGVFCEKPLAATLNEAQSALEVSARCGRPNIVNFEFGESDAWRCAQETIGQIGRLESIDVEWRVQTYGNRNRLESWKSRPDEGGGALQAFVAHTFYAMEQFGGPMARLKAQLGKAADDPRSGETEVTLEIEFASGCRGTVHVATDASPPHVHRIDIAGEAGAVRLINEGSDYLNEFRVLHAPECGAKMKAVFPRSNAPVLSVETAAPFDGRVAATARLVRKLVDWAVDRTPARPTFADAWRVQMLLETARRSNAESRWMEIVA